MTIFYATFPSLSIFCRLLWFSQILNMTIQDFQNIHSYHKITTEVFEFHLLWKISVLIGTSAKWRSYTVMLIKADTLFFKTKVIYSLGMLWPSLYAVFAFQNCLLWCVQKLKGKRVFRKIEIIHVRHIVSSVAQKQNSVDFSNSNCKLAMVSKVSYQTSRIASPQVIWILINWIRASSVP